MIPAKSLRIPKVQLSKWEKIENILVDASRDRNEYFSLSALGGCNEKTLHSSIVGLLLVRLNRSIFRLFLSDSQRGR